jgi:predicted aldo/keto reductase-like oxidoreductase
MSHDSGQLDRRGFMKSTAAGIGAVALGPSMLNGEEAARPAGIVREVDEKDLIWRSRDPRMDYRRLGRTNFMVSRIVAGNAGDEALWRRMLDRGMNYYDTGRHYGNHEVNLSGFLGRYRDRLWVTSKASGVAGWDKVDEDVARLYRQAIEAFLGESGGDLLVLHNRAIEKQKATGEKPDLRPAGKRIAELYAQKLDESLGRMEIDHVDAYFMHGVELPWIFDCVEIWEAYEKAHTAGKVRHFGVSTHKHIKPVLAACVAANAKGPWRIDVIMPGVNPETFGQNNDKSFDHLRPELEALKEQDVGIIAMKTKGIQNRPVDAREKKFETLMGGKTFNEWERAKLWMLHLTEGLIDACIAAMANVQEMEADLALPMVQLSAAAERELRALVKLEMAASCHLCGECETNCPEHIAVTDMIRYHAYLHQYNDQTITKEAYRLAGYDPAKVCNNCGKCMDACDSGVDITRYLHQITSALSRA